MSATTSRKSALVDALTARLSGHAESELEDLLALSHALHLRRTSTDVVEASEWADEVVPWLDLAGDAIDAVEALSFASLWLHHTRDLARHVGKGSEAREAEGALDRLLETLLPLGDQGAVLLALRGGLTEAMTPSAAVVSSDTDGDSPT